MGEREQFFNLPYKSRKYYNKVKKFILQSYCKLGGLAPWLLQVTKLMLMIVQFY